MYRKICQVEECHKEAVATTDRAIVEARNEKGYLVIYLDLCDTHDKQRSDYLQQYATEGQDG